MTVEWIGGHDPEAWLYSGPEETDLMEKIPLSTDVGVEELVKLFADKGFQMKKIEKVLPEPLKVTEFQGKEYRLYPDLYDFETVSLLVSPRARVLRIDNAEEVLLHIFPFLSGCLFKFFSGRPHSWIPGLRKTSIIGWGRRMQTRRGCGPGSTNTLRSGSQRVATSKTLFRRGLLENPIISMLLDLRTALCLLQKEQGGLIGLVTKNINWLSSFKRTLQNLL